MYLLQIEYESVKSVIELKERYYVMANKFVYFPSCSKIQDGKCVSIYYIIKCINFIAFTRICDECKPRSVTGQLAPYKNLF